MTGFPHQPTSDGGLESRVAAHVEQLYRSYEALVRSVCHSLLRDRVEAEDAVQQTFLSAQRALLNGSSPREPAPWLATIARNESLARLQARMREPLWVEIGEYGAAPDAYAAALQKHEASVLRDALAQLPRRQREAILLREVRGFTSDEVAAMLSVTAYAAESLVFRARRSLRARLQGALAGLSPGLWLQPLRDLATRLGSGELPTPAAAKIAAIGVGGLLVTGGALVGPRALDHGHGLRSKTLQSPGRSARAASPPASATFSSGLVRHEFRDLTTAHSSHSTEDDSTSRETSDRQRTSIQPSSDTSGDAGSTQLDGSGGSADSQPNATTAGTTDSGSSESQSDGTSGTHSQPGSTVDGSGQGD